MGTYLYSMIWYYPHYFPFKLQFLAYTHGTMIPISQKLCHFRVCNLSGKGENTYMKIYRLLSLNLENNIIEALTTKYNIRDWKNKII